MPLHSRYFCLFARVNWKAYKKAIEGNIVMTKVLQGIPLKVDIVSDVVCPWCIIGYKQLQKALGFMPGQFDVTIRWHPFELNPRMQKEGQNLRWRSQRMVVMRRRLGRNKKSGWIKKFTPCRPFFSTRNTWSPEHRKRRPSSVF